MVNVVVLTGVTFTVVVVVVLAVLEIGDVVLAVLETGDDAVTGCACEELVLRVTEIFQD